MDEARKPLQIFFAGLAIVGFLEFILSGTGTLYAKPYVLAILVIGCSVFFGAVELVGNRRLHTPFGVTASLAGMLIGLIVTGVVVARLLSML